LEQEPEFNPERTIFQEVYTSSDETSAAVARYEKALLSGTQKELQEAIHDMDHLNGWQYELRIKQILTGLKIDGLNNKMGELSGGQRKRVALAKMMIAESDLILLDEPTNHLDLDITEYLEEYLKRGKATILMVTHDRYFLDRVCNKIIELENGSLYTYNGNYSYFLEKREQRIENFNTETERAKNLLRGELDWMRRMPQARATKAKYRINAFYELKERAENVTREKSISIDVATSRLGKKIIHCKNLSHSYGDYKTIDSFTYNFARGEKIGLVGPNGVGKTTFLEVLTGAIKQDSGERDLGETIVFGYYRQNGLEFDPEETVIEAVRKFAEVVTLSDGNTIPVASFLNRFLFPHNMYYNKIGTLSGGERRRLYLVTVLMKSPNFLILDEPTNDLDIMSLNVLEEYLESFKGCVIVVTHDRYFLDKIAQHLFVFEGNGVIKDYVGKYSEYREMVRELERQETQKVRVAKEESLSAQREIQKNMPEPGGKVKLSFKEKRELESLEQQISDLENEKSSLETALNSGSMSSDDLIKASARFADLLKELETAGERWIELADRNS
jgi:ATP-binding cassette subfamily F protein uup